MLARMVTEMTDAGWGAQEWLTLAAVVVPTAAVGLTAWLHHRSIGRLDAKNEKAHSAITENVKAVDNRAETRADAQRTALEAIARDVSFMAGRQAERDSK